MDIILKNKCDAEEMEAASVAWVSMLKKTSMVAIKGVGNNIDEGDNYKDYVDNGPYICNKIAESVKSFIQLLPSGKLLTKNEFKLRKVVKALDLEKPIVEQKEMILNYADKGVKKSVPAKHDIITAFKINGDYFVLARPITNPIADHPVELKVSLGGIKKANYNVPLSTSINNEMILETQDEFSLSDFYLSPYHVTSRQPDWGKWSVSFIEMAGLAKNITSLSILKKKVMAMNERTEFSYGIYKLNEVIQAAKKTAGKPEGSDKRATLLTNYLDNTSQNMVVFNDNDITTLFSKLTPQQIFNR